MFISFEGIEGSGKSTAQRLLAEHFLGLGHDPLLTREPGGCALGRSLAPHFTGRPHTRAFQPRAELYLFWRTEPSMSRRSFARPWRPDTSCSATGTRIPPWLTRATARGLDPEHLRRINDMATGGLLPDLTLLLDLPVHCGLERAGLRNREEGTVLSEGRFDAESLEFHERVRQGYRALAVDEPERFAIIDAAQPPEDVMLQCLSAVEASLRGRGRGLD